MPVVELTVDRNLLCPNFDGYKLSLESVPVLRQDFVKEPLKLQPHLSQYSLLHVEIFSMHNLLVSDPWVRTNSYFINTAHEVVLCSYDAQSGRPHEQRVVCTIERNNHGDGFSQRAGDYNYSMRFISEKYCVLCDGMSTLSLLDTGDRVRAAQWQLVVRTPIDTNENARGYLLYDARLDIIQECKQISLVTGHVSRREPDNPEEIHVHALKLKWARWTQSMPNLSWTYDICQHLETTGSLYYCAFEPRAESLVLCSNHEIMTPDQRVEQAAAKAAAREGLDSPQRAQFNNGVAELQTPSGEPPTYTWTQTEEDLLLSFALRPGAGRNDFNICCSSNHVHVEYLAQTLLDGTLYASVDNDLTTWTVEPDCLRITMLKQNEMRWPQLLTPNEVQANEDVPNGRPPSVEHLPIPNLEEPVEECDFPLDSAVEEIKMVRYNLPTASITHTIFMGSTPPLFATSLRAGFPAAFATRQGVDTAIWLQVYQPSKPDEWSVRHEGNVHAFGYVQASKEHRKFIDCCADLDYAVICESYRHVFIYKPRYDTAAGLRKRNGPQVVIGKQSLVTLDDGVGEVLGLATAPNVITVLTEDALMYLQI